MEFDDIRKMFGESPKKAHEALLNFLRGEDLCEECPSADFEHVASLQSNEMEEWASIKAESERLKKAVERIAKEKEILSKRRKLFMAKQQLKSNELQSRLVIKDFKMYRVKCKSDCPFPPIL